MTKVLVLALEAVAVISAIADNKCNDKPNANWAPDADGPNYELQLSRCNPPGLQSCHSATEESVKILYLVDVQLLAYHPPKLLMMLFGTG